MNTICLIVDRLHAGYLGAYGNTWIETPAFDRLATESFLFDQAHIDTPELDALYRSFWQGRHAAAAHADRGPTLPALLRAAGVGSTLISDDPAVLRHPLSNDFDAVLQLDPPRPGEAVAQEAIEETHLSRCFAHVADWLATAQRPFFLWCHLAGLGTIWDAPLELADQYRQEDDPPPLESAAVPDRILPPDDDAAELARWRQKYAAQVSLFDICLEGFCEALAGHAAAAETMFVVGSSRGFPLGEHRRLGAADAALYGELVHVPLLVRFPEALGAAARGIPLVEPSDLWATLLDALQVPSPPRSPTGVSLMPLLRDEPIAARDRLLVVGPERRRAARTPAWHFLDAEPAELYAKPDDFWEANDVAVRCQEVVDCLRDAAGQLEQAIRTDTVAQLPALNPVLIEGLE